MFVLQICTTFFAGFVQFVDLSSNPSWERARSAHTLNPLCTPVFWTFDIQKMYILGVIWLLVISRSSRQPHFSGFRGEFYVKFLGIFIVSLFTASGKKNTDRSSCIMYRQQIQTLCWVRTQELHRYSCRVLLGLGIYAWPWARGVYQNEVLNIGCRLQITSQWQCKVSNYYMIRYRPPYF